MANPYVEDIVLTSFPTKEIFEHAHKEFPVAIANRQYPAEIPATRTALVQIRLPHDFFSMSLWTLIAIDHFGTGNRNLTMDVSAGACTELWNTHVATDTRNHAFVQNTYLCIDLLAIFAAFSALLTTNDIVRIVITNNTAASPWIIGSMIRY